MKRVVFMRLCHNVVLVFAALIFFFFFFNFQYYHQEIPPVYFLLGLTVVFLLLLVLLAIGEISSRNAFITLDRETETLRLKIGDYKLEAELFVALDNIVEVFSQEPDLGMVISRVAVSLRKLFRGETVLVWVYSGKSSSTSLRVVEGEEFKMDEEVIDEVVLRGNSVLINNLASFSRYKNFVEAGFVSILIAPLKKRNEVYGLLGVFCRSGRNFSSKDLDLLTVASRQISLLIENADLLDKTKLLSLTDGLTDLYNRRHFQEVIETEIEKAKKNNWKVSLAMSDLDYFKNYNDTNGHLAGDKALRQVANLFKEGTKGSDTVARYGGEEFAIIFPNTTKENSLKVCQRLGESIKDFKFPNEEKQPNKDFTISIGLATFPDDATRPEELIGKADAALYQAKKSGRDRVCAAR
ncbi:MAG: sensor domain-containing diguanylate cyclase [Candidatus Omnitrophica bacterium]|nr:sensor domain-containing diguanylate cyclase [Candidatus Omnitrophota bacterium]